LTRFLAIYFEILVATALPIETNKRKAFHIIQDALEDETFDSPPPSTSNREPSSEEKHKQTLIDCLRQEENTDCSNLDNVICQNRKSELTEEERGYDFLVELCDGELVQMRGFQPTADEVEDQ
jgi:hypothetical protein